MELVRHKGLLCQGVHMLAVLPREFGLQAPWRITEGEVMHRVGDVGEGGVDVSLFGPANLWNPMENCTKIPSVVEEILYQLANIVGDYEIL